MTMQTKTMHQLLERPRKAALVNEFLNKSLNQLRTPAMIIDRAIFSDNCADMHSRSKSWTVRFRAHLKTHKTVEGTKLQLQTSVDKTHAVVVSTLMEAWGVVKAGLVTDSTVKDILYGLPVAFNKVQDLSDLWDQISEDGGILRILIDNLDQVHFLEKFENARDKPRRWSAFVKIDGGQKRAGVSLISPSFHRLLSALFSSPVISVFGFYIHAGNSYASSSPSEASSFLSAEIESVNSAARAGLHALSLSPEKEFHQQPFVLSVGSTPTAHAVSTGERTKILDQLHGILELHAGNYPMLDLQQKHTGLIDERRIAQRILATVVSYYPGRGDAGEDEALIDAGAIAFSKDTGPLGGYGDVIGKPWRVGRVSQEHGILVRTDNGVLGQERLELGTQLQIVGQHACLIAAAHPWYYIVDKNIEDGKKVVDIWVPWKGW